MRNILKKDRVLAFFSLSVIIVLLLSACGGAPSGGVKKPSGVVEQEAESKSTNGKAPTEFPFGIVAKKFDSQGANAYQAKPGALLAFIQSGMAYDSPAPSNYVTVVDATSHEVLAQAAVDMPKGYQSHGMGVSANAQWIYMPSLSANSTLLHILNGRTLKLAKTLDVGDRSHHIDEGTFKQTGKFILADTASPAHGSIVLDPNNDNKVIGQIPFDVVGGRPYSAWSSPDGSFAYVTAKSPVTTAVGWIAKIDLATFKQTAIIPVGLAPVWVAFDAAGKTAWVSNGGSNDVMQITIGQTKDEKDKVVATVPMGFSPYGIVLSADGKKLYVVDKTYGAKGASTRVAVVNTDTGKVVKEITVGQQPDHVFLSPNGKEVWVGENRGNEISIIDTATDTVTGTIKMPGDVHTVKFVQF